MNFWELGFWQAGFWAADFWEEELDPVEPEGPVAMIYPRRLAKRPGLTKENEEALLLFVL